MGKFLAVMLAFTFSLGTRYSIWIIFFGVPLERTLFWHKFCAILTTGGCIYKGIVGLPKSKDNLGYNSGYALALLFILAFLTSLSPIRQKFFDFF